MNGDLNTLKAFGVYDIGVASKLKDEKLGEARERTPSPAPENGPERKLSVLRRSGNLQHPLPSFVVRTAVATCQLKKGSRPHTKINHNVTTLPGSREILFLRKTEEHSVDQPVGTVYVSKTTRSLHRGQKYLTSDGCSMLPFLSFPRSF